MSPQELKFHLLAKFRRYLRERDSLLFSSVDYNSLEWKQLGPRDFAVDLTLLNEAALALACFSELESLSEDEVPIELVAQLQDRIGICEADRARLQFELDRANQLARSHWNSFKAVEAELARLRLVISEQLALP